MKKFKRRNLTSEEFNFKVLLKRCVIFLCIFVLLYIVLTLIVSAIFYNTSDPTSKISVASMLSLYISIFISGYILSRVNNQKLFLGGLILGSMILILNLILCAIFDQGINTNDLPFVIAIPAVCILGSALGKKKERKKFRAKRFVK